MIIKIPHLKSAGITVRPMKTVPPLRFLIKSPILSVPGLFFKIRRSIHIINSKFVHPIVK